MTCAHDEKRQIQNKPGFAICEIFMIISQLIQWSQFHSTSLQLIYNNHEQLFWPHDKRYSRTMLTL